jgi:hypothetical protein
VAKRRGFIWRINGNGNYVGASRADFFVVRSVVRQLAEAEGSPIAAVEKENERILRNQIGEPSRMPAGIEQLGIRSESSRLWCRALHPTTILFFVRREGVRHFACSGHRRPFEESAARLLY